jgi:short-subunit dehydrogenase
VDLHFQGKRVLITGASKGIGAAAARAFAEEGCALHLAARGAPALDQLAQQLRHEHRIEVTTHAVDLRSAADLERLAGAAGNADVLVNNAGDIPPGSLDKVDEATWRHAWELKGHFERLGLRLLQSRAVDAHARAGARAGAGEHRRQRTGARAGID